MKYFLESSKKCERVVVNRVSFEKIKKWVMDVVGVKEHEVYCVEVKRDFSFDSVFAALKQAEFMCTACTHVYVCFPENEYESADQDLKNYLEDSCSEMGVGVLLVDRSHVEEVKKPDVEKVKNRIDFRNYYNVLTQLTGRLNKKEKKRLVKALGLLGLKMWLEDDLEELKSREKEIGRKAAQFLAFNNIRYVLTMPLYSEPHRKAAEKVLDLIEKEAKKRGLGPFELLATVDDLDRFLVGVSDVFAQIVKGLADLLRPYKGNLIELYKDKGPDGVYRELRKIRYVGSKTASLMMLELERRFGIGLPILTISELPDEMIEGLKKMGLDLSDFDEGYIPVIDVYGWLLRGGERKQEIDKKLRELYDRCKEIKNMLEKKLKESFRI